MAFCESDFVVIPAGVLLRHICGHARLPAQLDLPARRHRDLRPLQQPRAGSTAPAMSRRRS